VYNAFDIDYSRGASGAIIRDTGGNFVVACSDHAIDVMDMEEASLLAGLKLAEQFGAQSLLVESDSMELLNVVHNPSEFRGTSAMVFDDCRHLLMMLGTATLKHCRREANGAAHARLLAMVRLIVLGGVFGWMNLRLFLFLFL
jgi:ribonuclease HI